MLVRKQITGKKPFQKGTTLKREWHFCRQRRLSVTCSPTGYELQATQSRLRVVCSDSRETYEKVKLRQHGRCASFSAFRTTICMIQSLSCRWRIGIQSYPPPRNLRSRFMVTIPLRKLRLDWKPIGSESDAARTSLFSLLPFRPSNPAPTARTKSHPLPIIPETETIGRSTPGELCANRTDIN